MTIGWSHNHITNQKSPRSNNNNNNTNKNITQKNQSNQQRIKTIKNKLFPNTNINTKQNTTTAIVHQKIQHNTNKHEHHNRTKSSKQNQQNKTKSNKPKNASVKFLN